MPSECSHALTEGTFLRVGVSSKEGLVYQRVQFKTRKGKYD